MKNTTYLIQKLHEELSPEGKETLDKLIDSLMLELNDIKTLLIDE